MISGELPPVPLSSLKRKVESNSDHQGPAQQRGAPVVVELGRFPGANRAASVNVSANGVAKTRDGHERKDARHNERGFGGLGAKVEQCGGDGADVDGELELFGTRIISMAVHQFANIH